MSPQVCGCSHTPQVYSPQCSQCGVLKTEKSDHATALTRPSVYFPHHPGYNSKSRCGLQGPLWYVPPTTTPPLRARLPSSAAPASLHLWDHARHASGPWHCHFPAPGHISSRVTRLSPSLHWGLSSSLTLSKRLFLTSLSAVGTPPTHTYTAPDILCPRLPLYLSSDHLFPLDVFFVSCFSAELEYKLPQSQALRSFVRFCSLSTQSTGWHVAHTQ